MGSAAALEILAARLREEQVRAPDQASHERHQLLRDRVEAELASRPTVAE
jgi:hypothetical protein